MPRLARSGSTVVRARTIAADRDRLWELVCDPHHLPRWWPGVQRVEGVQDARFTQVLRTERGRPVRADFVVVEHEPPARLAWRQQLAGSPFARVLENSVVHLALEPAGDATTVTITQVQKLRGASRTGGFMLRRATAKRLDEALTGLAAVSEASPD